MPGPNFLAARIQRAPGHDWDGDAFFDKRHNPLEEGWRGLIIDPDFTTFKRET